MATGGTSGGIGTLPSPVTVEAGDSLAPSNNAIGTLTINSAVKLDGTNPMEVSKTGATITSDLLSGVTSLAYGGTLQLALGGDAIKLYDATGYVDAFTTLEPATLGTSLALDTSTLTTDGRLVSLPFIAGRCLLQV